MLLPMRTFPITDIDAARRLKDLRDNEAPKWKKSNKDTDEEQRAQPLKDKDDPQCTKHNTDMDEPIRA